MLHKFSEDGGIWRLQVRETGEHRFACVSAPKPTEVTILVNSKEVEHVYVGTYSPHTWWGMGGQPLTDILAVNDVLAIHASSACSFRLEYSGKLQEIA